MERPSDPRQDGPADFARAVRTAQGRTEFLSALRAVYREADLVAASSGATCLGGGGCCKFDLTGHRLYVSTGELSLLMLSPPPRPRRALQHRCPYQVGPRCMARALRPLGCRLFFCNPGARAWSQSAYEPFHRRIRELHDQHGVGYRYVEMTCALAMLSELETATPVLDR
ncbi:MAG TPA: hypothetical protein VMZ50_04605 [Phycisphaerae bacterium]|nr:hypothetical protein [Phycisphaerae bacterium]